MHVYYKQLDTIDWIPSNNADRIYIYIHKERKHLLNSRCLDHDHVDNVSIYC